MSVEKLQMHSPNIVDDNIKKIGDLFPNCITETKDENGHIKQAIDFDILKQELSDSIVSGKEERYQFTWPEKRKSILLANSPISETLRPCIEESLGKDGTPGKFDSENLYIEGDNLDVLKLLQQTYVNQIKMIYIDPPYNTGKDFIYEDNYAINTEEYLSNSGQFDNKGNQLVQQTESNGRYHTNWINMIYPRLKLARNLLKDSGAIFVSIDDNEQCNLKKVCDEIFGESNFIAQFTRKGSGGRQDSKYYAIVHEYILVYAKDISKFESGKIVKDDDVYPFYDDKLGAHYKTQLLRKWGENSRRQDRPNLYYSIKDPDGNDNFPMLSNTEEGCWRWGKQTMSENIAKGLVEFKKRNNKWVAYEKILEPKAGEEKTKLYTTIIDDISNSTGASLLKKLFSGKVFDYPKPVELITRVLDLIKLDVNDIVLDFFSGSATTAEAVIQYNLKHYEKQLKYILIQLPAECETSTDAYQQGYKNICEIGKERIRRTVKQISEESIDKKITCDLGFRNLKLDSTNMKNIFYSPTEISQLSLDGLVDNIKEDRTPYDLLFQVMLDLAVPLSNSIEEITIFGKKIYNIQNNYLIACLDSDITNEIIVEIAKMKPYYFVMRDNSMQNDSVASNFEQIFNTYSPTTIRRVL